MQEIVSKVLETEKAAEQSIQEARARAGEIRAQVDREVQEKLQQAREQAASRAQEILEQARSQAQGEYEKAVRQSQDENREFFRKHEQQIDRAAEAVIMLVIAPEWS